jgi:acetyl-CoA carboxylase carboxyltransferase component
VTAGAPSSVAAQVAAQLDPVGRLEALFDPGTLTVLDEPQSDRAIAVVAAIGTVAGRLVVGYAQDSRLGGGATGELEAEAIVRALRVARRRRAPVVAFLESAGARLQEGAAALGGLGRVFSENVALSGYVPQISVLTGTAAGGGCYSPALTDFIVMTRKASMFLTGPRVVHAAVGEDVTADALGGTDVHQGNGVCQVVVDDDFEAVSVTRELLGYLTGDVRPRRDLSAPLCASGDYVPRSARRVYDMRDVVRELVDDGRFLEMAPMWARNLVTGFARIGGASVGIVANQPRYIGGVLDVHAAEKGAGFVRTCDDYGIPLLVLVDTPGFLPGLRQEAAGVIRHGAQLVRAFAQATVPRVTVILRKAFGGAYISMNSKDLGADAALAWSGAEIGIMGPHAAVAILHRAELTGPDGRDGLADRLAERYRARNISAPRALELGLLDGVIAPQATREQVISALAAASDRRSQGQVSRAR